MNCKTMLRANVKRHGGGLLGVFALILIVCLALATVLAVRYNSQNYVRGEIERLGFGGLTAWVSDVPDMEALERELSALPDTAKLEAQPLVFADYEVNGQESDSEGQLLAYDPERYPYRIFRDGLSGYQDEPAAIGPGEAYVSPSLTSMFGVRRGDEIRFSIARAGVGKTFVVKGFFEDPFMGSSMIGMKSFLICPQDLNEIAQTAEAAGIDALARPGAMLHLFQSQGSPHSAAEWNGLLNERTSLPQYAEFVHSADTIAGFMLILQNVFAGFLLAFVAVLLAAAMLVLGHSIGTAIERDTVDMGILKAMGFTNRMLRRLQLTQYLGAVLGGMAAGLPAAMGAVPAVNRMTITATGMLMPSDLPLGLCAAAYAAILALLAGFIRLKVMKIDRITPLDAIRGGGVSRPAKSRGLTPLHQTGLPFWMALRQLVTGKKQYASACVVAVLLVFFASMAGRVNAWLGPDGKGLMDAFNPADHDLGVQCFGQLSQDDVKNTILKYAAITDEYLLAMPNVTVNGVDYTANVISQPERFHMLRGRAGAGEHEIVLTESAAADLGADIGDSVTLSGGGKSGEYTVSGIYQCANDMGANLGMSREAYSLIGEDTPSMWCFHYFLEDPGQKAAVMKDLEETYGGDIHVHENAWPGLYGIIGAMRALMAGMYGVIAVFILIAVLLTGSKLLLAEQRQLGVYKALGLTSGRLRGAFALRFGIVALAGAILGILCSVLLTDPLVASVMRLCGISNFASQPGLGSIVLPAAAVTAMFAGFAWFASGGIQRVDLTALISE